MRTSLPDRARRVLATLVREFIETGEPVASAGLAREGGFGVSPATIRSELARLEEEGYLWQPHTSAGRIPTDRGYRAYVDHLLEFGWRATPRDVEERLRQQAGCPPQMEEVLPLASLAISRALHQVGFALCSDGDAGSFHRIEFLPLADSRVLVVLVGKSGQISNKVVDIGERLGPDQLRQAAAYLNGQFSGLKLSEVLAAVVHRLSMEQTLCDVLTLQALRLARTTLEDMAPQTSVFIGGAAALAEEVSESGSGISIAALAVLLKMIEEKHRLVRLLTEYIEGPGLTIVIGTEHSDPEMRNFSLVASTYFDGEQTGTVGLIGPTRMRYAKAIAMVDNMARAVSRVLKPEG
jgi:heat-inducible transcriptional repressor